MTFGRAALWRRRIVCCLWPRDARAARRDAARRSAAMLLGRLRTGVTLG